MDHFRLRSHRPQNWTLEKRLNPLFDRYSGISRNWGKCPEPLKMDETPWNRPILGNLRLDDPRGSKRWRVNDP